jgi:hypothetical protein
MLENISYSQAAKTKFVLLQSILHSILDKKLKFYITKVEQLSHVQWPVDP